MTKDKETTPEPIKQKEKMEAKTFAATGIGSNGVCLLIKRSDDNTPQFKCLKRVVFICVPLWLGKDVFTLGKISEDRATVVMCTMKGLGQFMLLHQVGQYRACATTAMRDVDNGKKVMKEVEREKGIKLETIRGEGEAQLLCNNIIEQINSQTGNLVYADVGGGSIEISLLHGGVLAENHPFDMGALYMLSGKAINVTKHQMRGMLDEYAEYFPDTQIIGSGGNTNKLFRLTHDKNDEKQMKVEELKEVYGALFELSEEEREEKYGLEDGRADVTIPTTEIFLTVTKALKRDTIYVPNISLADSIVDGLYRGYCQTKWEVM